MTVFKPRLTAPSSTDKNYIHYTKGGYNTCIIIDKATGSVLSNCVGYSQGRLLELMGATKANWKLPACNPIDWIKTAKKNGLPTGTTPKLGAVIVWNDHIANVEDIKSNGDLFLSESHYKGAKFTTRTVTKASGYLYASGKQFLGFVYCGIEFEPPKTKIEVGDKVVFTGSKHFTSANGSTYKPASSGNAKVTKIVEGAKHPYHCINEGGGCSVYGWVNKTDVKLR